MHDNGRIDIMTRICILAKLPQATHAVQTRFTLGQLCALVNHIQRNKQIQSDLMKRLNGAESKIERFTNGKTQRT